MALKFFNTDHEVVTSADFFFNARYGSVQETLFYIRNDDSSRYYTNVIASITSDIYDMLSEFGNSGWSVKLLYGQRRPTEAEWDVVRSGESLALPDIGTTLAADTSVYQPVWVRAYCPAHEKADTIDAWSLEISFIERLVGS